MFFGSSFVFCERSVENSVKSAIELSVRFKLNRILVDFTASGKNISLLYV